MATIPDILNDNWDGYKRTDVRLGLQAKLRELLEKIREIEDSGQELIELDAELDNGDIVLTLVVDSEDASKNRSVTLPVASAVAGKLSQNEDTGRLDYSKAPCMVLASMGSLDGGSRYMMHAGDTYYSEQSNDLIYCKQVARLIHIAPDKAVLYCNAMTGKLYRWNGSGMVEVADKLTNSQASQVMDLIDESMNTGSHLLCLASMGADYDVFDGEAWEYDPQGEEMYFDGTFIRRADDNSLMEDPDPSKLYFNLRTRLFYVWDGGTFANVGGGSSEEFDQGKYNRLVTAINNLNGRVSALIGALANLAFEGTKPDEAFDPWPATPSGDKVTVSIDSDNLNDAFVEGNTSIEIDTGGLVTIAVKPDEGKFLRELKYAVGEGAQSIAMVNDSTKHRALITINNVTSDITVHLYGYADDPNSYTVKLPSDLEFTDHSTQTTALEGSSFSRDVQLADPDEGVTLKSVTVQYNYNGSTQTDTSYADEQGVCHIEINDFTGISQVSFTTESAGETYNVTLNGNSLHFSEDNPDHSVGAGGTYRNTIRARDNFNLVDVTVSSGTYGSFNKTLNQSTDTCEIEIVGVQSDITISVATEADTQPVTQFVVGPGSLAQLTLSPSGDVMVDGNVNGNYRGKLSVAEDVTGKRLPDEIVLVGSRQQSLQSLSPQSQSSALSGLTPRPDLDVVSLESSMLGEQNYDYLCDRFSYSPGTGDININGVKHDIYINAIAQDDVATRKLTLKLLNIAPTDEVNEYATDSFGYPYAWVATNGDFEIVLEGIVTDETLGTRATLNGDVAVKSGGVDLFRQSEATLSDGVYSQNGITLDTSDGTLTIPSSVLDDSTADIIIEATACTGQIVLTAKDENSKFAFSYTDGNNTTESVSAQNWQTDSNTGITSVTIPCSELKALTGLSSGSLLSIDFGGAKFSGNTLEGMFSGFTVLTHVKGLVVTNSVTSLASMFYNCSLLQEFDTIGWDTSNVTDIRRMAYHCTVLEKVDLGSKDMGELIYAGSSTTTTSDVDSVFCRCEHLSLLDVSYWNVPKLVSLWGFVCYCISLTRFDASTWSATNVNDIHGMFCGCTKLTNVDISGIDTRGANNTNKISEISYVFYNCPKLEHITIDKFDTSAVDTINSIWWQASTKITLHCKSTDVADCAVSSDDNKNWIKAATGTSGKGKITAIKVPDGCVEDYKEEWNFAASIISAE